MKTSTAFSYAFIFLCIFQSVSADNEKLDTGDLTRQNFPKDFLFGTATSAYQVEGMADKAGRGPSIWDAYVKVPGNIAENATGDVSVDQYHRYKDDIDLMVKLNMDAYRFSISWSRIFPSIIYFLSIHSNSDFIDVFI